MGQQVCQRWISDRMDMTEGTWSGNDASCMAGDITSVGRTNALRLVNLYRFLANLPAVGEDSSLDQNDQACALMMDANMMLSHMPTTNWECYTDTAAAAAASSTIATLPSVSAVALYMDDPGNASTLGHRRWILSNSLGPIGIGSTSGYSCMWVLGGSGDAGAAFTAWPTPGAFPYDALGAVDETGWSIQSDTVDLSQASVSVRDGASRLNVQVTQLEGGYGSTYAIDFIPQGWSAQAGHSYSVSVSGVTPTISYTVDVVSCPDGG
jgi:hypothetical protein